MENLSVEQLHGYFDLAMEKAITYAPKLILAVLVLIVGLWMIRRAVRVATFALNKTAEDASLTRFLTSLLSVILKILLFVSVASMVGIATNSFVAILGAAGLAVALALQGSLSNFAGGVLILVFRPYRIGDFIESEGVSGTVKDIQIFNTVLSTPDNKSVVIPNAKLANGIVTNYSKEPTRRVDLVFSIAYSDAIALAKTAVENVIAEDERVLPEPVPLVVVSELADSSVNLTARVWVNSADFWRVKCDLTERVKLAFDDHGISIPFPQRDVHVIQLDDHQPTN